MKLRTSLYFLIIVLLYGACGQSTPKDSPDKTQESATGGAGKELVSLPYYKTIPHFSFLNQDSIQVTNQTFGGKIYVAEFFFTSCPTICPVMKTQLLRVYNQFKDNPQVMFLSHTIDPLHDTVAVLREYARQVGVNSDKWHFVTGDEDEIYGLGRNYYLVTATKSTTQPGGLLHSGAFILVDKEGRVRSLYDGTSPAEADKLIKDIETLLAD